MSKKKGRERKVRILVIEDNPLDIDLLRRALLAVDLPCELTVMEDGAEALAFFRRFATIETGLAPDLLVLDLNLPKKDGIDVLRAIRATRGFANAGSSLEFLRIAERARVEQFESACYISKPPDLDEFLKIGSTIKELLAESPAGT